MEIDPATICARTGAGETELARPRSGLTLPQRKALSLLAAPRAYAEFAAENHLDPERLTRDFARLAELGLITLQLDSANVVLRAPARAQSAPARQAAVSGPRATAPAADPQLQPVVIGAAPGRTPLKVAAFATAAVIALTAGWLALRDGPQATPRADAAAPQTASALPPPLPAPIASSTPAPALPEASAPATVAPANPAAPAVATVSAARAVATDRPAASRDARSAMAAVVAPRRESTGPAVAQASDRPLPSPTPASERTPEPTDPLPGASAPPPPAPAAAPVLLASAARQSIAATPSPKPSLRPVVSEAPEFPKEAVAEGVTSGAVKARVTVDASGKVAGIEIIEAQPRRIFDRAVRAALWHWQFEPGASNRTAEVDIAFTR